MPTVSEPLAEGQAWTYTRCREAFKAGQIGEATFRVSLSILGLRKQDIDAEVFHANQEIIQRPRWSR
jgi:hypothetical protein